MSNSSEDTTIEGIVPKDYDHIHHNGQERKVKKETVKEKELIATEMIAPSDYEHIYKGEPIKRASKDKLPKKKDDGITQMIAPSDYEHIYASSSSPTTTSKTTSRSRSTSQSSFASASSDTTSFEEPIGKKYKYSSTSLTKLTLIEIRRVLDSFVSDSVFYPEDY